GLNPSLITVICTSPGGTCSTTRPSTFVSDVRPETTTCARAMGPRSPVTTSSTFDCACSSDAAMTKIQRLAMKDKKLLAAHDCPKLKAASSPPTRRAATERALSVFIRVYPWPLSVAYDAAVPYRIEFVDPSGGAFARLVELGALDVEIEGSRVVALIPDSTTPEAIASPLAVAGVARSAAVGRDEGSVWLLRPRAFQVGPLRIVPAGNDADPAAIKLIDAAAFGTGLHPTTALSIEALDDILQRDPDVNVLDVGTGSGVLALAASRLGAREVVAIDIDEDALRVAAENARLNALDDRVRLAHG